MVDYLTDMDINEDKDVHIDDTNDWTLTDGVENLHQGIALSGLNITQQFVGGRNTVENLALLEQRIEEYLDDDPHVSDVLRVETQSINRNSNTVTMRIFLTENDSFEITVGDS